MCLLILDMDRASSFPDESRNINPRQNDLHGFVSYPSRYYSRPQRPVRSGIPRWPGAIKPEPAFQPSRPSFPGTCPRNAVQQNTVDISVKTNAGNQAVNENAPASTPAAKDVTTTALEKLKWQAGQGPIVDLRLLVPGRVGLLFTVLLSKESVMTQLCVFISLLVSVVFVMGIVLWLCLVSFLRCARTLV